MNYRARARHVTCDGGGDGDDERVGGGGLEKRTPAFNGGRQAGRFALVRTTTEREKRKEKLREKKKVRI